jgi:predicted O-methyltransferase YrrM
MVFSALHTSAMKKIVIPTHLLRPFVVVLLFLSLTQCTRAQETLQSADKDTDVDRKVKTFLRAHAGKWNDLNIPVSDGELLYNIIVAKGYKHGLEIGTSTGHSAIWIAWAFSKTGGKLITIEIDASRHKQALANFREAGLSEYIDARLADAHELVKTLDGPFDFVFSDADKGWYTNYFRDVSPKLTSGGCFTAHNVTSTTRGMYGTTDYLKYVLSLDNYTTTVDLSGGGVAISYKH